MKNANSFNHLINPQSIHKYIPTSEATEIILSYFVYNNFQDFNTWQQIARTKIEYDYLENNKGMFICKVTLKWEEKGFPTIVESLEAKNKKNAKKRVLKKLIENIIFQGLITYGFKDQTFLDKLPRRRKNESDVSSDEIQEEKCHSQIQQMRQLLKKALYYQAFNMISLENVNEIWNYGLKIKSLKFCENVISMLKSGNIEHDLTCLGAMNEAIVPEQSLLKQFYYQKQSKDPFQEDLADFIRYYQLQKSTNKGTSIANKEISFNLCPLPSEVVLFKSKQHPPSQQQMFHYFLPIQGRKVFFKQQIENNKTFLGQFDNIQIPKFQTNQQDIPVKVVEKLYELILYYCQHYQFCLSVVQMMGRSIKNVSIAFDSSIKFNHRQQGEKYYMKHKNLLTAEFLYLLHNKIENKYLAIEGLLVNFKIDENIMTFNCKQPEQILSKKINKKTNVNEFEEMMQISSNEYVLLISKLNTSEQYIGQVIQVMPSLKIHIPSLFQDQMDPSPFTMYKLYNSKIYQKTSSAILQASKHLMSLFQNHTHLIFQPPTFPHLSVISELLIEWTCNKCSILIISMHFDIIHAELTALGFKVLKITSKLEEKLIPKFNIFCSSPNGVCCDLLKNCAFTRVIIDGAHQISQIISLPAIVKGCKQLYLLGDQNMPRMNALSQYTNSRGINISIFQRLYYLNHPTVTYFSQIEKNYGDKAILQWMNVKFYCNKLIFFGDDKKTPVIKGFPWPSYDYRICFLHLNHNNDKNANQYINDQAFICTFICAQVVKSGYTNIEQITCSTLDRKTIGVLRAHFALLLKRMQITDMRLLSKLVQRFARLASGSFSYRSDLSILMTGIESHELDIKHLLAALSEGSRGAIIIGDMHKLKVSDSWNDFLLWCSAKRLISQINF